MKIQSIFASLLMSLLITAGITSCSSDDTVIDIMEEASPQNDAFEIDTIDSATDNVAKVYLSYRITSVP